MDLSDSKSSDINLSLFWSHFSSKPPFKLQQSLMNIIYNNSADLLLSSANSLKDKARLLACRVKHSGAWLSALPSHSYLSLMDSHYALTFRLRLGLPPQDDLPLFCECHAPLDENDINHFFRCKLYRRTFITGRHDIIVHLLATFIRSAGGAVFIEPKHLSNKRPDSQVRWPGDTDLVDASITDPTCPSYVQSASSFPLAAAGYRERSKRTKYLPVATEERAGFVPFVMETFGGFGKDALAFLDKISKIHSELSPFPTSPFALKSFMVRALSVALQRGNAYVQLRAAQAVRTHAGAQVGYAFQ